MGINTLSRLIYWFYVLDIYVLCDGRLGQAVFSFALTIYTLKGFKYITVVTMGSSEKGVY